MRRALIVVAVVAMVALAGCSGGSTGGTTTAPDASPTDGATTTTTQTTTTTDLAALDEQSWVYANRSVAFDRLYEQHRWTLANASTYRFSQDIYSNTGRTTLTEVAVDNDAERANLSIETTYSDDDTNIQGTYVADGTVYSKSGTADDPKYDREERNLTGEAFDRFASSQTRIGIGGGVPQALNFEYVGVEDGAYVFEADSIAASERTSFDADNVTSVSARLAVAPEGYVREFSLSLTVEMADGTQTAEAEVRTTGVNETDVSEPSWTSKAD